MPVYDYQCTVCQRIFTDEAPMNSERLTRAPDCDDARCSVRRCLTSVASSIKGAKATPTQTDSAAPTPKPAYMTESPAHTCSKYCSHH